jgi:hypothetical protein
MKKLKNEDFRREVSDIMLYIASLGEVIDPDHLVIKAKYRSLQSPEDVMKVLEKFDMGEIFEPNLDHLHPARKKITLSLSEGEYKTLVNEELPLGVKAIDICKIRLLFDCIKDGNGIKTQLSSIVPIVNPKISLLSDKEQNEALERYEFSKIINGEKVYGTPPYVDAIIYHLITSLSKGFFSKYSQVAEGGAQLVLENISYSYLSSKYRKFNTLLQSFQRELKQYLQ